ncbi:MAG: IS66 family insertion sequence element accessory protein TnpB [Candidatus Tectomicrobia bacterium]|nr:IS66 family insertion sequence element accessory protein TnpB [Candidatus Tectomicrobia bacterium]
MIQLTPQSRVFVAVEPADFRRGIDGLAQTCRQQLDGDPFSGAIFVFRNKARTSIKLLTYDGQGFWLCLKRLSKGKQHWWPASADATVTLSPRALQVLLWNGHPEQAQMAADWKRVA